MEYDLKLNCKTGLESVVKTRSVDDALEDNNIESGTEVSAKQEPVKNSEIKEGEYSGFNTYDAPNCAPCEKVLHEESSLVHHMQESPDMEKDDQKGSWSDEVALDEPEKKNHVDDDNERKIETSTIIKPAYGTLEDSYFENGAKAPAKPESANNGNTRAYIEKISGEEESNGDDKQEDTEKEDVLSEVLIARDLSSVQETTTGNYCEECKDTFKNKKELRRHLMTAHVTIRTLACESCKVVFIAWTDLKSHACKVHGNSRNDKRKRKEISFFIIRRFISNTCY